MNNIYPGTWHFADPARLLPLFAVAAFFIIGGSQTLYAGTEEITYSDGQKLSVLTPENYDPGQTYPAVYFMPEDGYSARAYLEDGIGDRLTELQAEGSIGPMIYVFPEFREDKDLKTQLEDAVEAVSEHFPVIQDPSGRGIIGTGAGAYLAFMFGYGADDKEPDEEPALFSAIAAHEGDFTSDNNRFVEEYGDLHDILDKYVGNFGSDSRWLGNYYTYLDSGSDDPLTWAEHGTADIAYLYRRGGLAGEGSLPAWDYSVFEYAILSGEHYGSYLDNLRRSLAGFSKAFGINAADEEAQTQTEYKPKETVASGEGRMIDLMGDWHFITMDALEKDGRLPDGGSIDEILEADWEKWDVVQPALGWWTEDFAPCLNGNANYIGYAWYVRQFDVPEGFDISGLQIEAGMVDEADEVYINGVRVGQTGIPDEGGSYDGTNPWDEERIYAVPDGLIQEGTNTVCVRVCNGSGGGGWYAGPVQIEAAKEEGDDPASEGLRFYTDSFASDALKGQEIEYRVYLPEGYYESELRYPVVYMLHGYGSTGKSFEIAGVDKVLDEGIASGEVPECIVIFPSDGHPQKSGWWSGAYAKMLNEDLVSHIDSTLRTQDRRESRFLAGESMGGGGAYLNALNHPELYGGVLDIYGALRYTDALKTFLSMDESELGKFRHYIICGSHDMYCFDLDHILMGKHLNDLGIEYVLEIDNGEHSSAFYLPRLKEGFSFLLEGTGPS